MQILERWKFCLFVIGTYLAASARCQADLPACEVSKARPPPTLIHSFRKLYQSSCMDASSYPEETCTFKLGSVHTPSLADLQS